MDKSKLFHCLMVDGMYESFVMESLQNGMIIFPVSEWVDSYTLDGWWFQIYNPGHCCSEYHKIMFRVYLANDPGCICGCAFEDAIHFILECCLYNEAREELKLRLVFLHELKIEVLLFGDDTLTEMQNLQIFKSVQLYIKRTKRFTHL